MDNYTDNLSKDYEGNVLVTFIASLIVPETKNIGLLNGYVGKNNVVKKLMPHFDLVKKTRRSPVQLRYNASNDTLYASISITFESKVSESIIKDVKDYVQKYLKESTDFKDQNLVVDKVKIDINLTNDKQEIFITQNQLEAPEGFIFLEDIFEETVDSAGYPEFMNNQLMYNQLVSICVKADKKITDGAYTGVMLPIHAKDPGTGATLVLKEVKPLYLQYKLAQNYLRGFEEGTPEYQTGTLMMLVPEFSKFMLGTAQRAVLGGKVNPNTYKTKLTRAIKFVKKYRSSYLDIGHVNAQIPEQIEKEDKKKD